MLPRCQATARGKPMARQPSDLLHVLNGGRVLDVGTGKGQFVQDLVNDLGSYSEIIGIDISDDGAAAFEQSFAGTPSVRFLVADAESMPFADESFETVAIAGSLPLPRGDQAVGHVLG
jgi:ubiquinone/menaquinone biosynthesis C-methylase UbiE